MKTKKLRIPADGLSTLFAALICVVIGLVVGFIALVIIAWNVLATSGNPYTVGDIFDTVYRYGLQQIVKGGFFLAPMGVGKWIADAAPLIMCGLSVAFAFKTGLFNIGAAGQYTLGAFGGLYCAIVLGLPWWACLIGATAAGAIWGAIPGLCKAFLNINEVITSIMFNWIGLYMVNVIMYGNGASPMFDVKQTKTWVLRNLYPDAVIPDVGMSTFFMNRSTTISIFLAIVVAVVVYMVINKTTFGYELKACGHNKDAARYAGINEKRNIVLSMVIAGALAGFGAGLYYLSGVGEWNPMDSTALPAMGFNGIAVALLASSNPIGCVVSSLFIAHISTGGGFMNANYFPAEVADIISGIIIYLCAFSMLFKGKLVKLFYRKSRENVNAEPATAPPDDGNEGEGDEA